MKSSTFSMDLSIAQSHSMSGLNGIVVLEVEPNLEVVAEGMYVERARRPEEEVARAPPRRVAREVARRLPGAGTLVEHVIREILCDHVLVFVHLKHFVAVRAVRSLALNGPAPRVLVAHRPDRAHALVRGRRVRDDERGA